jgi:dihydroorotase
LLSLAQQTPEAGSPSFDLLIKGGTVIDPGQQLHAPRDVAVKMGKVVAVSPDIPEKMAVKTVQAKGYLVTPGLIDIHTHCYDKVGIGTNADQYCLRRGVTTVVDAGSAGYSMIPNFRKYIVNTSATRIRLLVDIGPFGVVVSGNYRNAENMALVKPQLTAMAVEENRPVTVGVKARLQESVQGASDVEYLKRALQAAEAARVPLMVHIDGPHSPLPDLLGLLRRGDIYTHCFNNHKNGMLDGNGKIIPEALEARQRGVVFDIAEGQEHLSFDVAEKCLQQNFFPDTISTDLTNVDAEKRVFDLPTLVSKFLALGYELDKAIAMVTINPSKVFDYGAEIGTLQPGKEADIAIFELQDGSFEFEDGDGKTRSARKRLVNKAVVRGGELLINEAFG